VAVRRRLQYAFNRNLLARHRKSHPNKKMAADDWFNVPAFLIMFREALEAAVIVAVLLQLVAKLNMKDVGGVFPAKEERIVQAGSTCLINLKTLFLYVECQPLRSNTQDTVHNV
jgi:hypothetical protein